MMNHLGNINNRGMALLLVISVISLLTVIIVQFNRNMSNELVRSYQFRDRTQLHALAESGVNLGIAALYTDTYVSDSDTVHDNWNKIVELPFEDLVGGSEIRVKVTDLSGKFQLNSLVETVTEGGENQGNRITPEESRKVFINLLTSGEFLLEDDFQAQEIADAIIDWIDSDDDETAYGAESSYYESLDPAYQARNGLMELPMEILSIKGVSKELLYGNDEKKGLSEYITVFGNDGKINLNTADPLIIAAFDDRIDGKDVELLTEFRNSEENIESLGNPLWYQDVAGWPGFVQLNSDLISVSSNFFKIESEAVLVNGRLQMTAYVKRTGQDSIEILYRRVE